LNDDGRPVGLTFAFAIVFPVFHEKGPRFSAQPCI
jgi:hypothetical protein